MGLDKIVFCHPPTPLKGEQSVHYQRKQRKIKSAWRHREVVYIVKGVYTMVGNDGTRNLLIAALYSMQIYRCKKEI